MLLLFAFDLRSRSLRFHFKANDFLLAQLLWCVAIAVDSCQMLSLEIIVVVACFAAVYNRACMSCMQIHLADSSFSNLFVIQMFLYVRYRLLGECSFYTVCLLLLDIVLMECFGHSINPEINSVSLIFLAFLVRQIKQCTRAGEVFPSNMELV